MTDSATRLVLRRTTEDKGNKFVVRLGPEVNRASDLYDLFRDGFVIEVMDIEKTTDEDGSCVTLGVSASPAFRIDRTEKLCAPRNDDEIGAEECVSYAVKSEDEVTDMTIENVDAWLIQLREAEVSLRWQRTRLKEDKSLAHERGYRHANNDHHHRWVMIVEEINIVSEQLERVQSAIQQATAARKAKLFELNNERRRGFQDRFIKLAKETLGSKEFESLKAAAEVA